MDFWRNCETFFLIRETTHGFSWLWETMFFVEQPKISILGAEVHLFIYLFILLLQFLERSKETFPLKEMIEPGYRFSEYLSDKILEHSADSI